MFKTDVYQCNWGIILPCKSGVSWEIQCDGVCCHHVEIEGVFIPLGRPYLQYNPFDNSSFTRRDPQDLLGSLQQANYTYRKKDVKKIWKEIKKAMHFDFEDVDGDPPSREGFKWIKFTKFEPGWGHCGWVEQLIGKTVVLVYPNCD